jgi:hypothetical protein
MRVTNRSSFHPIRKLQAVLDFLRESAPTLADVTLRDQAWGRFSGGYATKLPFPSITIWLSRSLAYPCITCHVPEVGAISVSDFEEEVVLVLAHELRHVLHFTGKPRRYTTANAGAAEVDAERFAAKMLKGWRKRFAIELLKERTEANKTPVRTWG